MSEPIGAINPEHLHVTLVALRAWWEAFTRPAVASWPERDLYDAAERLFAQPEPELPHCSFGNCMVTNRLIYYAMGPTAFQLCRDHDAVVRQAVLT